MNSSLDLNRIIQGDCLDVLKTFPDNFFDSCVSDVPYGLGPKDPTPEQIIAYLNGKELDTGGDFMGKRWAIPSVNLWKEVFRVLKPGAHVLAFGGTRTFDLISMGLRSAGFDNRDTIASDHPAVQWCYGSGMPKSTNVGKKIGLGPPPSHSSCDPSYNYDGPCLCDGEQEKADPLDSREGHPAGGISRLSSSIGNRSSGSTEEHRKSCSKASEITGDPRLPRKSNQKFGSSMLQLREDHEEEATLNSEEQESILLTGMQLSRAEDKGHSPPSVWPRLEEPSRGNSQTGQGLPCLREDLGKEWFCSSCPPSETLPLRRDQPGRKSSGPVWHLPPQDRILDNPSPTGNSDHCISTEHSDGLYCGSIDPLGRRCPRCGRLEKTFFKHVKSAGTGLKPSWEPILVFRKPFKGPLFKNVLAHGTGTLNIAASRVKHSSPGDLAKHKKQVDTVRAKGGVRGNSWKNSSDLSGANAVDEGGRWPANKVMTHHPDCHLGALESLPPQNSCAEGCPIRALDEQAGNRPSTLTGRADPNKSHTHPGTEFNENSTFLGKRTHHSNVYADDGGPSRYFQQFQSELDLPFHFSAKANRKEAGGGEFKVVHPTPKPLSLMKYLIKLVTPPGGVVLDPYCGSGSTLHAAVLEGCSYIGIELGLEGEYEEGVRRMEVIHRQMDESLEQEELFNYAMADDEPDLP